MKQTALEWYAEQLGVTTGSMLERAKAMEKQQIEEAFNQGYRDGESDASNPTKVSIDVSEFANAEHYYNETFKANEK